MFKQDYLDMTKIITSAKIYRLFDAVEDYGGMIRFVGGAVRDALAGYSGSDIDLATDLSPDELVEACENYGLKTMPIGLKQSDVGVMADNQILRVSSLQREVKIDGRKHIEFTDDWSADASRRDLTINAVYADLHGNVFDYYNGIEDLKNGLIRFIGDPKERIKEDYLRIMRFFRFYARFGKIEPDEASLKACINLKDGLRTIAIERVRDELFKLLVVPRVAETMSVIYDNNILGYFLPPSQHIDALKRLIKIVADAKYEGNFLRRLFVLYQPNAAQAEDIAKTLRFTKKQRETFTEWAKIDVSAENFGTPANRLDFIYRYGKQFCIDKLLLSISINNLQISNLTQILSEIESVSVPVFPLRGRDLLHLGLSDADIGQKLDFLERRWIGSRYTLTRDELLQMADK